MPSVNDGFPVPSWGERYWRPVFLKLFAGKEGGPEGASPEVGVNLQKREFLRADIMTGHQSDAAEDAVIA